MVEYERGDEKDKEEITATSHSSHKNGMDFAFMHETPLWKFDVRDMFDVCVCKCDDADWLKNRINANIQA